MTHPSNPARLASMVAAVDIPPCSVKRSHSVLGYVSDVEGCPDYWEKYLQHNDNIVKRDPVSKELVMPQEDTAFVYGGDVFDKGTGDLRIALELVKLKKKYPDRVTLLMGNRDINKMKLSTELSLGTVEDPKDVPNPYYFDCTSYAQYLSDLNLKPSPSSKLKWLLECTMGCATTFECRRKEVTQLLDREATDDDVVKSFADSVKPGGAVYEYMTHSQLLAAKNGTLFIHGAITPTSIGFVPNTEWLQEIDRTLDLPKEAAGSGGDDKKNNKVKVIPEGTSYLNDPNGLEQWVEELNLFSKTQVEDWTKYPTGINPTTKRRGGSSLLAYPHQRAIPHSHAVCTARFAAPTLEYQDAASVMFLNTHGITRVVAGHMPCGDTPVVIQQPGLLTVVADTSYCCSKQGKGRGEAIAELLLYEDGRTRLRGLRGDGMPYDFDPASYQLVGKRTSDGWWTKVAATASSSVEASATKKQALTEDPKQVKYLAHKTEDSYYSVDYKWMTHDELTSATSQAGGEAVKGDSSFAYLKTAAKPEKETTTETTLGSGAVLKSKVKPKE